ncbi:MAG: ABC transporter permease [Bacteroidaceae bacterium]|nr:ABC transporter permease [Bacteroidaceae bacterium]
MIRQYYARYWKESFRSFLYIFNREMRNVFRDEGVILFFIVVPVFYPILYSSIYTTETIREVPVAVVDDSRSALSREYVRKVDATPDVSVLRVCANLDEAREMVRRREVYGIVNIPRSFSADIARGQQTRVSLFCDMSGLLYYKAILVANTDVSLTLNADIKIARAGNTTAEQDRVTEYPIAYTSVNLYNPQGGMASFLLPAVLILILQQTLILGVGLLAGTARETNRLHELIPVERSHHGLLRIVFGKALVYLLIYVAQSVIALGVIPRIFSLPQIGNPVTIAFFLAPFLLAITFFAMTLSALIRERENVILIIVFASVPLLFLSGISWPASAMPGWLKLISYIFPSTFGINGFVHINTMGADLLDVRGEWDALWVQSAVYFLTCCLTFRYKILRARVRTYRLYKEERASREVRVG